MSALHSFNIFIVGVGLEWVKVRACNGGSSVFRHPNWLRLSPLRTGYLENIVVALAPSYVSFLLKQGEVSAACQTVESAIAILAAARIESSVSPPVPVRTIEQRHRY